MRCPICQHLVEPLPILRIDLTRRFGFSVAVLGVGAILDLVTGFGSIADVSGVFALGIAALGRLIVVFLGFWRLFLHARHGAALLPGQRLTMTVMFLAFFAMGMWASDLTAVLLGPTR